MPKIAITSLLPYAKGLYAAWHPPRHRSRRRQFGSLVVLSGTLNMLGQTPRTGQAAAVRSCRGNGRRRKIAKILPVVLKAQADRRRKSALAARAVFVPVCPSVSGAQMEPRRREAKKPAVRVSGAPIAQSCIGEGMELAGFQVPKRQYQAKLRGDKARNFSGCRKLNAQVYCLA